MKILFFTTLTSLVSINSYAAELKSLIKTCSNFSVTKSSISAFCTSENNAKYITSLRLRGINNINGVLTVDSDSRVMSKFHTTCTKMSIDPNGVLFANCRNNQNIYVLTSVNLNSLLRNYNGTLVYPLFED